jgi:serine protease
MKGLRGILLFLLVLGCAQNEEFTDGSYIVVLNSTAEAKELEESYELPEAEKTFSKTIKAGVYDLTKEQAQALADDPNVAFLEKDQIITINAVQKNAIWGLDRIDQVNLPLNKEYKFPDIKTAVNVYVIDTGVLTTHPEFQGRAVHGYNTVNKNKDATDCNGHGTHVAGTIGSASYGVAKTAKIYGVKVLDCWGSGRLSDVLAGVEWVTVNHVKPAVANMSLGGGVSKALDQAVLNSINKGVTFVVAAGNMGELACDGSPARVKRAITVGSSNKADQVSYFSNFGSCVDVFAPGEQILSTWLGNSTEELDGTSMASPHVAGVAALYLAKNPKATPDQVSQRIIASAAKGKLSDVGWGSPNLLVNLVP